MSGYELAQRLHSHPNGSCCKLIALTGYNQEEDIARALQSGFDIHLAKPVPANVLLERVGQLVASRQRQAVSG
jgi:two-component system CheB/CheR fusion protein